MTTADEDIEQRPDDLPVDGPTSGLAVAATIIFLGNVGSRVLGLVREQLAAGSFGTGNAIASFTIADNLNTLLFDLLVNGMLQAAVIPVLAVLVTASVMSGPRFERVLGTMLAICLVAGGITAVAGVLFADQLVSLMTAIGGNEDLRGSDTRNLAVTCMRIVLPSLPFLAGAAVLSAGLYALRRPGGPAIGGMLRNAAIVMAILVAGDRLGVKSMAAGVLAGAVLMALAMLISLRRNRVLPRPAWHLRDPEIAMVSRLALPVLVGLFVSSAVVVIDRNLAWGAQEAAIGAMRYATSLVQLVLGLIAAAVALAALPGMAGRYARGDIDGFRADLSRALAIVTVLVIPAMAGLAVLSRPIVGMLFEHGKTDAAAARLITIALLAYLPGHALSAYDQVLIFAFYARHNTVLPVAVGIASSGVYLIAALVLVDRYEMAGLVAANSLQLAAHTIIMVWLTRKHFGTSAFGALGPLLPRVAAASLVMAAISGFGFVVVSAGAREMELVPGAAREAAVLLLSIGAGAIVYAVAARRLGIDLLDQVVAALSSRFRPAQKVDQPAARS